jgi:hypothetical protein
MHTVYLQIGNAPSVQEGRWTAKCRLQIAGFGVASSVPWSKAQVARKMTSFRRNIYPVPKKPDKLP